MEDKKTTPAARHFLHWYRTDYGRKIVVLIGDPKSASREIKRNFPKEVCEMLNENFTDMCDSYRWGKLDDKRSGREACLDYGYFALWFPQIPDVPVLAHEILHAVQDICENMHIHDNEFEAYTLDMLFEYFLAKLNHDATKPFVRRDGKMVAL